MKQINRLITLSLLSTCFAFAVEIPNSSTINKEIKIPKNIQKNKDGLIELDGLKQPLPPMIDDKSGKTIFVKNFHFKGNTKLNSEELENLLKEYLNKDLTFNDLKNAATIITKAYRDKGYFVARAYIPMQKMDEGVIIIAIIEGSLGDFEIENKSLVNDTTLQAILDQAKNDPIISASTLERAMLIANDTPGVIISQADVKAGKKVGYSDFEIGVLPSAAYNGYIIADNHGSRYTGEERLMVGGDINSPFKIGDKLSLVGLASSKTNLKYGNISYDSLLHPSGLRGGIGYSYTKYELDEEYKELDSTGTTKVISLDLSYPIIRQRDEKFYTTFEFEHKNNTDKIGSTNTSSKKELNVATLGLEYSLNSFISSIPSNYDLKVYYTYGNLDLKDSDSLANDQAGADTNGDYSKIYLEALQTLFITSNLSVEGKLSYQHSLENKNLDGSEDLSIGGVDGVKVYPTSEASAENGYIFSIEGKYSLPTFSNIASSVGVFYDYAKASLADSSKIENETVSLQDMGLSYYLTYNDLFINSYMAWRVNSDTVSSEPNYSSKFLVQAGWVF